MPDIQAIPGFQASLGLLQTLFPASGVIHVGAGGGASAALYARWGVTNALLIEAQEGHQRSLAALAQGRPGWRVAGVLVGAREEDVDFYVTSNPKESGIIAPDRQLHLWRNLKAVRRQALRCVRLDTLLGPPPPEGAGFNWVFVDCLPALPVLEGAGSRSDEWDVVVIRGALADQSLQGLGATKPEIDAFLGGRGFRCLMWEEERQPALAQIAYVRDWKTILAERSLAQAEAAAGIQARSDEAQRSNVELGKRAATLQQKMDELAGEHARQMQRCQVERDDAIAQKAQQVSEQARQVQLSQVERDEAIGRKARLEELAAERHEQVSEMAAELERQRGWEDRRQAEIHQLRIQHDERVRTMQARLEELQARIDGLVSEGQDKARQMAELEQERAGLEHRQRRLDEELAKAEAQIELITDVVLREKAF